MLYVKWTTVIQYKNTHYNWIILTNWLKQNEANDNAASMLATGATLKTATSATETKYSRQFSIKQT